MRKSARLNVRINSDIADIVEDIHTTESISKSNIIRDALGLYIEKRNRRLSKGKKV